MHGMGQEMESLKEIPQNGIQKQTIADALSSFHGHGKPSVFESAMKSQIALKVLSGFGKSLPVTSQTKKHGKVYHQVCLYMYKDNTSETSLKPVPKSWMQ